MPGSNAIKPPLPATISLSELQAHNGDDGTYWTAVRGEVLDITEWVLSGNHPGGSVIRLASGRDATTLFESYHPPSSSKRVAAALLRHGKKIGMLEGAEICDDRFFQTVRERVMELLSSRGLHWHSYQWLLALQTLATVAVYLVSGYYKTVHNSFAAGAVFAIAVAQIGFLMHHAVHRGANRRAWVNDLGSWLAELAGSSHFVWQYEHNVLHHCDPNHIGKDHDCEIGFPVVRFHPELPQRWWHRYNHLIAVSSFSIGRIKFFSSDISKFMDHGIDYALGHHRAYFRPSTFDWVSMVFCKSSHIVLHILLPLYWHGLSGLSLFFFVIVLVSHYQEVLFEVNHIQSGLVPPTKSEKGRPLHWSERQVLATSNYGARSHLQNIFSGGLGHQIEHHLFPTMTAHLYPLVAPTVEQVCREFGLPYRNYPTYFHAWYAWYCYLRDELSAPTVRE